jgi:hypothetical protein
VQQLRPGNRLGGALRANQPRERALAARPRPYLGFARTFNELLHSADRALIRERPE